MQRFDIAIPEEVLTDLRQRLKRTRWPGDFNNTDWAYGTEQGYLSPMEQPERLVEDLRAFFRPLRG